MSERERVEVGGSIYYIRPFDPFLALEIMGDLQQRFLAPLLPTLDAVGEDTAKMEAAAMGGIARLSAGLSGKELRAWADKLLLADFIAVAIDGADPDNPRKLDLGARTMALKSPTDIIELCIAVGRVNFAPVFTRAAGLIGQGRSLAAASRSGGSAIN